MNHKRTQGRISALIYLLAIMLFCAAFTGCATTAEGGRASPAVPVATFLAGPDAAVAVDVRSNLDVSVVTARLSGICGIRDAYTGAWLYPPHIVAAGTTLVHRVKPAHTGHYPVGTPLPAWVATAPGLWLPGEAAKLGYTFEDAPAPATPDAPL